MTNDQDTGEVTDAVELAETSPATPDHTRILEAFVDALGVVIARAMTMFAISVLGALPFLFAMMLIPSQNSWFLLLSTYGFVYSSAMLTIEYFEKARHNNVNDVFESMPTFAKSIVAILFIPAIPMSVGIIPIVGLINKRFRSSFIMKTEFDILLFFFQSSIAFSCIVYCVSRDFGYSEVFLVKPVANVDFISSAIFTIDLILKGVLFDILEHFNISISSISQTTDLRGLLLSFILRITSSVLVISIAIDVFRDARKRLRWNVD